jgi:bacteriorhodopsin
MRCFLLFLLATGLLALFALLRADTKDERFMTALSVAINTIAVIHYDRILDVRREYAPGTIINNEKEMEVDSLRHSDWLITMPLLVIKLYKLINHPNWLSEEWAVVTAVAMIALGAFVRVGFDDEDSCWSIIPFFLSICCLGVLIAALAGASSGMEYETFLNSFFYVWIGYPIVALVTWVVKRRSPSEENTIRLSVCKDIFYGLLDCYSKGVLAWWTAWTVFGEQFFGNAQALPYNWTA